MELKGKKINFLGDSITEGHGASSVEKCFVNLIAEREGAICRNYGIGGSRITCQERLSVNPRWDMNFCSRVQEMNADADIVVVFGGTNDFGHGEALLGEPADRTPETFWGANHTLFSTLIEKYPEAIIVVLTSLHRTTEDDPQGDHIREHKTAPLKEYVKIIREAAGYYGLPVLDLFANSGMQPKVPVIKEKFMPDGLHPNDAGYEKLANKIISFLKSL